MLCDIYTNTFATASWRRTVLVLRVRAVSMKEKKKNDRLDKRCLNRYEVYDVITNIYVSVYCLIINNVNNEATV